MTASSLLRFLIIAATLATATAQNAPIEEALKKLSSEESRERNEAFQTIWKSGKDSLDRLKTLVASEDPEVARRANLLLQRITLHLTPDSPPEVIKLIDEYPSLDPEGRITALRKLTHPEFSFALLTLWSEEKDSLVKNTLEKEASKAFEAAIRTASRRGEATEVASLLKLFPNHPTRPALLAGLSSLTGTLPAKIKTLEASNRKEDQTVLLACYRRSGDLEKALALARNIGAKESIVSLSLLAGDSLPYLRWHEQVPTNIPTQKKTLAIIRAQEEAKGEKAEALARELLADAEAAKTERERSFIFRSLHLTGYFDLTLPSLEKHDSSLLSALYPSTFQTDKGLARYKFPASEKEQQKWLVERVKKIIKTGNYQSTSADDLFYLASRLETLGDLDQCRKILAPIEIASRAASEEHWQDYLNRMPRSLRYTMLLKTIGDDWKEDDYLSLLKYFFASQIEDTLPLWNLLAKDKNLSLKNRFDEMATFCGWTNPTRAERNESWQGMIKRGRKDDALLDLIIRNGIGIEPVSIVSEAMLARAHRFEKLTRALQLETVKQFVYLRDWEHALEFIQRMVSPEKHAPGLLAGILKKSGRLKEADKILTQAMQIHLADPARLSPLAADLTLTGCHTEASSIKKRIAFELPPSSSAWSQNLPWMLSNAETQGDRKMAKAASLAIVIAQAKSRSWSKASVPLSANLRLNVYRGLNLIDSGNRNEGHDLIQQAAKPLVGSPAITDTLLSSLKQKDYPQVYDQLFNRTYQHLLKTTTKYPRYHFAQNTVAWLCAVTGRHLTEALQHSEASLQNHPRASYCDTLARIYRKLGKRKEEIHWQENAIRRSVFTNFSRRAAILSRYDWILENPAAPKAE
ncbi:MAG: hypothetical protein ACJAVK_002432 [Akkermansiaceae bacterium]|jgi:hypothetical protein